MQITNSAGPTLDFLQRLIGLYCIDESDIRKTTDGFVAVGKSISAILENSRQSSRKWVWNAIKEIVAPGVSPSARIPFSCSYSCSRILKRLYVTPSFPGTQYRNQSSRKFRHSMICPFSSGMVRIPLPSTDENRMLLWKEINRVVSYPGQKHDPSLKAYFIQPEAQGPYLVAQMYVQQIKSFAVDGILPVPKAYAALYKARHIQRKAARLPDFIDANNRAAGRVVCDHKYIYIQDTENLTDFEKRAILATHTGNISIHSFAAEVRYHAMFLVWYARLPIPFLKSTPYASAIRADMTIEDKELEGPTPFYDMNSRFVKDQIQVHKYAVL